MSLAFLAPLASRPLSEVRRELLTRTLEHAATVPFYADCWGEAWKQVKDVPDLSSLPLLTKELAVAEQERLLAPGFSSRFVGTISSGTSHGDKRPLRVPRHPDEQAALREYERQRAVERAVVPAAYEGLVLELRSMQHGLPEHAAPAHLLRIPWTFTANTFRLFRELLEHPQPDGRRVTGVIAGVAALRPLTAQLLETGVDPASFQVREIGTNGLRLAPYWRTRFEQVWNATLFDNYSLSEIATPALECKHCGFNHWRSPPLIAEVLDAFDKTPLEEGTGLLTLTTLFPFVQAMPLVRYQTNDLVQLGPPCPQAGGERGVLFRGRINQTIVRPGQRGDPIVVAPTDVEDFLDSCPEVARYPHPVTTLGLVRSPDVGPVKYELTLAREAPFEPRVVFEVRFDPNLFTEHARRLAQGLGLHLLAQSPRLRELETSGEGELDLQLVGPGLLEKKWGKF